MKSALQNSLFPLWCVVLSAAIGHGAEPLATAITAQSLDPQSYAEWVDGAERAIRPQEERDRRGTPLWVVGTREGVAGYNGIEYGRSKTAGPRHLRIGFRTPVGVGSVLACGGGRVSVLRPEAVWPGDLGDDRQWIDAQRLASDATVGSAEAGRTDYAVWTLPQVVSTRAIRFTHVAADVDRDYAGFLGGVYVFPERMANLGPQAIAAAGSNDKEAHRVVNQQTDGVWQAWSNLPDKEGQRAGPVSAESP